jgi:hypothetical protein
MQGKEFRYESITKNTLDMSTSTVIRIILEIGIVYGIYTETGMWTAIFAATIAVWIHLNDVSMRSVFKAMDIKSKDIDHAIKDAKSFGELLEEKMEQRKKEYEKSAKEKN